MDTTPEPLKVYSQKPLISSEERHKLACLIRNSSDIYTDAYWFEFVETWTLSGKSRQTIKNVAQALRIAILEGELYTMKDWDDVQMVFRTFHALKAKKHWSPATFNTYRKNCNTYFAFLVRRGILKASPILRIEKMHEQQHNYPLPSEEDLVRFFDYLRNDPCPYALIRKRNLLFFRLIMVTGMRPKEALDMKLGNIGDKRDALVIEGIKMGGKPRAYSLDTWLKNLLTDYLREVAYLRRDKELERNLFLGFRKWQAWTYSGVRKFLERVNVQIPLSCPLTCYGFRRWCATRLFRSNMPLERISKYLGHTRTATTMRYIQGIPEVNAEAQSIMSQFATGIDQPIRAF